MYHQLDDIGHKMTIHLLDEYSFHNVMGFLTRHDAENMLLAVKNTNPIIRKIASERLFTCSIRKEQKS